MSKGVLSQITKNIKPPPDVRFGNSDFIKHDFKIIVVNEFGTEYELDLTNILQHNLENYDRFERADLLVQDERISSIQFSIIEGIKRLSGELKGAKIEYRIWLSEANKEAKKELNVSLKAQRRDPDLKPIVKSPTKEDILDQVLYDLNRKVIYILHEETTGTLQDKLTFLKSVFDILVNRSITIKAILNKMELIKPLNRDSNI